MRVTLDIAQADLEKLVNATLNEPRIVLNKITWEKYEQLIAIFNNQPRLRLSYLEETLEIMTNSPEHEMIKSLIARLIETFALEMNIDLYSYGSATFQQEASIRGLEPDESYCIGQRREIPDLAIEVVINSGGINKLEIYKGLNISEVWFWENGNFTVYYLVDATVGYKPVNRSQLLPNLDLNCLAKYVNPAEEPQMVRAYRQAIKRSQS
jgi:Uma2 family endonuclease